MPAKQRQSSIVGVRFTAAERKALEQVAQKAGLTLSQFIRRKLLGGKL